MATQDPYADLLGISQPEAQGEFKLPYTGSSLARMDLGVADAFQSMAQEYYEATGNPLKITDAFRTRGAQAEAYRNKPNLAARPSHSLHERGMALDIDPMQVEELSWTGLLDKHGFRRPMLGGGPGKKNEPWHIEASSVDELEKRMTIQAATVKDPYADLLGEEQPKGKDPYADLIAGAPRQPTEITPETVMAGAPEAALVKTKDIPYRPLPLAEIGGTAKEMITGKPQSVMMPDDTYNELQKKYPIFKGEAIAAEKPSPKLFEPEKKERLYAEPDSWGDKIVSSLADPDLMLGFGGEAPPPIEAQAEPAKRFAPEKTPTIKGEPLTWAQIAQKNLAVFNKPTLDGLVGFAKIAEDLLALPRMATEGELKPSRTLSRAAKKLREVGAPEEQMPYPEEWLATLPGQVAGGLAPYAALGGILPGGATILGKFLHNLATFSTVDAVRGYGEEGEDGAKKGLYHSVPAAVAFTLAGALPGRPLQSLGTGAAFVSGGIIAGERDPRKLTADFLTGMGLHWLGTRGEAKREKFGKYVEDWKKENGVTDKEFDKIKEVLSQPVEMEVPKEEPTPTPEPPLKPPEPSVAAWKPETDNTYFWEKTKSILDEIRSKGKDKGLEAMRFRKGGDADRGYAELIEKYFDKLPKDVQDFWAKQQIGDLEVAETRYGTERVTGGHVWAVREASEYEKIQPSYEPPPKAPEPAVVAREGEVGVTPEVPVREGEVPAKESINIIENKLKMKGYEIRSEPFGQLIMPNGKGIGPTNDRGVVNHWEVAVDAGFLPESQLHKLDYLPSEIVNGLLKMGWIRTKGLEGYGVWGLDRNKADIIQKNLDNRAGRELENKKIYVEDESTGKSYKFTIGDYKQNDFDLLKTLKRAEIKKFKPSDAIDFSQIISPAKAGAKEPWEMTRKEYFKDNVVPGKVGFTGAPLPKKDIKTKAQLVKELPPKAIESLTNFHRQEIEQALAQGKPVPPEVLADYPDLAAKGKGEVEALTKIKATYNLDKALERYDLPTIIKAYGGFNSKADILKNFAPEERRLLFPFMRKGAQGPDALLDELKTSYPHLFGEYETDAQLLKAIVDGDLHKTLKNDKLLADLEAHDEAIARQAATEGFDKEALAQAQADVEREALVERSAIQSEGSAGKTATPPLSPGQIKAIYPDISDAQATILARDPELRRAFAKGNWEVLLREKAQAQVSDIGAQKTLEGVPTGKMFGGGPDVETIVNAGKFAYDYATRKTPGLDILRNVKRGIQSLVLPTAKSPEHLKAAETLGAELGTMFRKSATAEKIIKGHRRAFDKMGIFDIDIPLEQNPGIKFASDIMQGRKMEPRLQKMADDARRLFDQGLKDLESAGVPLEQPRENYFPNIVTKESRRAVNQAIGEFVKERGWSGEEIPNLNEWNPADKASVKTRAQELLKAGEGSDIDAFSYLSKRPFKGKEAFRKPKVFDDIMTAVEFGYEPVSPNPFDIVRLKLMEINRSAMANRAINKWMPQGDIVNVNNSGIPLKKNLREGFNIDEWGKLNDKYGIIWHRNPDTHLLEKIGYRVAKKPVADILNNYLSSSLYNNPHFGQAYKAVMGIGNLLNQFQLGLGSLFHGGFTSIDTQLSTNALVIKDLYGVVRGNRTWTQLGETLKRVPTAMVRTGMEGSKNLAEWRSPSMDTPTNIPVHQLNQTTEGRVAIIAKASELAGMKWEMERGLRTHQSEQLIRDWYGGKKGKAILRSPIALSEASMWPVMVGLVPRQKFGVFGELVGRILEQNPNKTLEELTPALRQAGNRVDARLGQVGYDRLFINNTAKNVIQLLMRAPGWAGGTLSEIGGSVKDAGKFIAEWYETGKAPQDIPDRVAYTLSLLGTMALTNGLLTYLFTGEKPTGMDYWAFRSGGVDDKGRPNRWLLPSYAKEIYSWFNRPAETAVAKLHPLLGLMNDIRRNRTFYGDMIRTEDAGLGRQTLETGEYVLKAFEPFWTRGVRKALEREGEGIFESPQTIAAPLIGIMPAPRFYTGTKATELMDKYYQLQGHKVKTPEEARVAELKSKAVIAGRKGELEKMDKIVTQLEQKYKLTDKQVDELYKKADTPHFAYGFKQIKEFDVALRVWDKATSDEKALAASVMAKKLSNLEKNNPDKYDELEPRLDALWDEIFDAEEKADAHSFLSKTKPRGGAVTKGEARP